MQTLKSLYGEVTLEMEDLIESKIDYLVELAYYKINNKYHEATRYSVEIVKTEHLKNGTNVESKQVNLFTSDETKTDYILEQLKKNKVTPIGLKDSIIELIKAEAL